jgi:hypothetical protein
MVTNCFLTPLSKEQWNFRRQPGIPLPEPELITYVCPTSRFPLKFVINAGQAFNLYAPAGGLQESS